MISSTLAQSIIDRLAHTLDQQLNFMNTRGQIIASTDPSRVGTYHEGARHTIQTGRNLYIAYDGQFQGAKKGINMPVYYEDLIIGVIGLTGDPEVEKYAEIVKGMTEILVREAYLKEISFKKREQSRLIIEGLLLGENAMTDGVFNLDFSNPYRVIAGSLETSDPSLLHQLLESHFNLFVIYPTHFIILMAENDGFEKALNAFQSHAEKRSDHPLKLGIGLSAHEKSQFQRSYQTALSCLKWIGSKPISRGYFEGLNLGILLSESSSENQNLYQKDLVGNLSPGELRQLIEVLRIYAKYNGSISKCAEALFIHKNTFQYQLQKIKKLTGYDPRNYEEFAILYPLTLLNLP